MHSLAASSTTGRDVTYPADFPKRCQWVLGLCFLEIFFSFQPFLSLSGSAWANRGPGQSGRWVSLSYPGDSLQGLRPSSFLCSVQMRGSATPIPPLTGNFPHVYPMLCNHCTPQLLLSCRKWQAPSLLHFINLHTPFLWNSPTGWCAKINQNWHKEWTRGIQLPIHTRRGLKLGGWWYSSKTG